MGTIIEAGSGSGWKPERAAGLQQAVALSLRNVRSPGIAPLMLPPAKAFLDPCRTGFILDILHPSKVPFYSSCWTGAHSPFPLASCCFWFVGMLGKWPEDARKENVAHPLPWYGSFPLFKGQHTSLALLPVALCPCPPMNLHSGGWLALVLTESPGAATTPVLPLQTFVGVFHRP